MSKLKIIQGETKKTCQWHRNTDGEVYGDVGILPNGTCPWLYHTLYPYFLGMLYGARFHFNEHGDCQVCCPAHKGVDVVVKKRDNDGTYDPRIPAHMTYVIFAEVIGVKGDCPYGHKVGDKVIFPTCMPEHYMCPAGFNNVFPFLDLEPPACIDKSQMRCPDWEMEIPFSVTDKAPGKDL
ncbi:MAG: hypothetical protein K1X83_02705 [Oligoflexia bacterium]|nr:hypothetical protein [Oligoflexia bacterium]